MQATKHSYQPPTVAVSPPAYERPTSRDNPSTQSLSSVSIDRTFLPRQLTVEPSPSSQPTVRPTYQPSSSSTASRVNDSQTATAAAVTVSMSYRPPETASLPVTVRRRAADKSHLPIAVGTFAPLIQYYYYY